MAKKYVKINKCPNCYFFLKSKIRKNYFQQQRQTKRRYFNKIFEKLKQIATYASTIGLNLMPVEFRKNDNRDFTKKDITIIESKANDFHFSVAKAFDLSMVSLQKYQMIKNNLNHKFYPSKGKIISIRNKINTIFKLNTNNFGFFFDVKQKLEYVLKYIANKNGFEAENEIKIKFCADGFSISKSKIQILNFCFTVINDPKTAMSINGTFLIGNFLFKIK